MAGLESEDHFPLCEVFNKMNIPPNIRSEKAVKTLLFVVLFNKIYCFFLSRCLIQ